MSESTPEAELRQQVARLQARLDRERAARRESEDIAEATLLRLYQRQQELDLLSRVTSIANSAADTTEAFQSAMDLIRAATGWQAGHYFLPARDDPTVMVSSGQWSGDPDDPFLKELRSATSGLRFPPGLGIPGTAYLNGATWEPDISRSRNFPRQQWLQGGSAFAFPILIGAEVVAVMEFIQRTPRPAQPGLLEIANVLGIQLGRMVERTRAQVRESKHRTALQDAVEQRTSDLIAARNRAEAQAQARSTLFSTVSHDLQTPLHAAMAEMQSATTAADPAESLGRATVYLSELEQRIRAIVELTGTGGSEREGLPRVVELATVLQDVVKAHNATLRHLEEQPEVMVTGQASHPVLIDVEKFQMLVHTLLAGRLIEPLPGPVRIRLEVRSHWAELSVEEPASGSASTTLALTKQLARSCDGEATLVQLPDRRRRTEVRIPVAVQGRPRCGSGTRVLLVDDIAVTRQISAAMLTRLGAQVHTAENGLEAIDVLRGNDFALVLMDLRMPVLGGLEATRRIRAGEAGASRSDVPVVALTAHSATGDAERSLLAGMDAHMTKPFTFDDLRTTVLQYAPDLSVG